MNDDDDDQTTTVPISEADVFRAALGYCIRRVETAATSEEKDLWQRKLEQNEKALKSLGES